MNEIVIGMPLLHDLVEQMRDEVERGAVLFLNHDPVSDRYLVAEAVVAADGEYLSATKSEITFAPHFLTAMTRRARRDGKSMAIVHSHPSGCNNFSTVDDSTEAALADFMRNRLGENACFSLILCDGHLKARRFATQTFLPVREVGSNVVVTGRSEAQDQERERFDRQVRAFGVNGQAILRQLSVAIIGLGGTGSVAAQQLAHLGLGHFLLFDDDKIEETNLNRVVGSTDSTIGRQKVEVAAEMILRINQDASVTRHVGSVVSYAALDLLRTADVVLVCTDSHSSRAFLSAFAYQYLIPAFDVGVAINAREGRVDAITGRTQMLAPGLPCLWCSQSIDAGRIREELMTREDRAADPYFNEGGQRQPAVISLNSTMVSMAITMLLGAFTSIPVTARWQQYSALTGQVRLRTAEVRGDCATCGPRGAIGAGVSRTLPFLSARGL
ncbi:HesA/MoeB/ThiF family protein [Caballeronia zhejiangensis]|uniref:HesA/MoeB/ThiF family protein n=1 Tax=Caballeronia zhejiangensis TaxID=871203 RepID=UPI001EF57967|nr:ThiF family adenylyltransferase [Caballeronia zhejiangensis]MCG7400385.1 ThiF family adenylyltransferase [Caballeronia zhejiangensis]